MWATKTRGLTYYYYRSAGLLTSLLIASLTNSRTLSQLLPMPSELTSLTFRLWSSPGAPTSSHAWRPGRPGLRISSRLTHAIKWSWSCDFDLFFPVFSHTYELYSLATIPNWRQRCRKAACFISEVWSDMLPEYLLELLSAFDHVFIGHRHRVEDVARITGRPCTYLPLAVDVPRFAPASCDQPRPIEVCNVGRRSPVTHQALLDDAERRHSFYYYDTVAASGSDLKDRTFRVDSPHEHRRKLATLLKHSCYYIANRSYVNRPEFTAGRDEISARFYEGAAAGTVMIGEAPRTEEFKQQFDWPDAVIHVPFDSPDIGRILADLNGDPERLRAIRRNNVRQAAQRHDWLHRIQVVFDTLGLAPTEKMRARAKRLEQIASNALAPCSYEIGSQYETIDRPSGTLGEGIIFQGA